MDTDTKRAMKQGLSQRMRDFAIRRRCPRCGRKSALRHDRMDIYTSILVCRWKDCGYERAVGSGAPVAGEEGGESDGE